MTNEPQPSPCGVFKGAVIGADVTNELVHETRPSKIDYTVLVKMRNISVTAKLAIHVPIVYLILSKFIQL